MNDECTIVCTKYLYTRNTFQVIQVLTSDVKHSRMGIEPCGVQPLRFLTPTDQDSKRFQDGSDPYIGQSENEDVCFFM